MTTPNPSPAKARFLELIEARLAHAPLLTYRETAKDLCAALADLEREHAEALAKSYAEGQAVALTWRDELQATMQTAHAEELEQLRIEHEEEIERVRIEYAQSVKERRLAIMRGQ
jgi:hypothetical protein